MAGPAAGGHESAHAGATAAGEMVREGARSLSRDLAEMASVYNFGFWKTLRHVTLPQLAPFLIAAARGETLVGMIDQVRVWNAARTAAQICTAAGKPSCP